MKTKEDEFQEKLDGIDFYLAYIDEDLREFSRGGVTKKEMLTKMSVLLNHVNTIKGIIEYERISINRKAKQRSERKTSE